MDDLNSEQRVSDTGPRPPRVTPSGLLLVLVGAAGVVLVLTSIVLAQYFDRDVLTSLLYSARDGQCPAGDMNEGIGIHCFGDYYQVVNLALERDPWELLSNYLPANMLPHLLFGGIGALAGSPVVGLVLYLFVCAIALVSPAIWASQGKPIYVRILVCGVLGLLSIPALAALDRGNSVALAVPGVLVTLIAVARGRGILLATGLVLAALIKPQFALLLVIPLIMRRWRVALVAAGLVIAFNLLAFLAWPANFPATVPEAIGSVLKFGNTVSLAESFPPNVSFAQAVHHVEMGFRALVGMQIVESWTDRHAGLVGTMIVGAILVAILLLGRRIPLVLASSIVVVLAALLPSVTRPYYLVATLPIAAILLRDPKAFHRPDVWNGAMDDLGRSFGQQLAVLLVATATAASIAQFFVPAIFTFANTVTLVGTTVGSVPCLWLAAIVGVVLFFGIRPSRSGAPDLPPRTQDGSR